MTTSTVRWGRGGEKEEKAVRDRKRAEKLRGWGKKKGQEGDAVYQMIWAQPNCGWVCLSPSIRQMVISQPDSSIICSQTAWERNFCLRLGKVWLVRFTRHKNTRETVLCKSTHKDTKRKQCERQKQITGPLAKSHPVIISIYFRLSSLSLAVWIIHSAGMCRNYSTVVDETKLQGCIVGEMQL